MKRRLRIITYAWGRQYVANLLDITLAAVLAPGNLPALAEVFDCEFVLLTEQGLFEQVETHPIYRRLQTYAKARLIPIDDLLVAPLYGLTLTWATYRGMEDLGETCTDTDFLFFTADWIPADGSYRTLIPHLLKRERLIVAPSYCVISEKVLPKLREWIDPETGILAMPAREMAALGIPNRHNTIRGKTINSHLFHMDIIEQFYWLVDPDTLLGHQMPIAIVCMSPERWVPAPNTFWDYGTVSELCPNVKPTVLGDSDDFLMIELRNESTYDDGLRMGWPDVDTIGRKLAGFVTRDHTVYGRHQLVLHSKDLPPETKVASTKLHAFVDRVFTHFDGKEVAHAGHPFWSFQSSIFDIARRCSEIGLGAGNRPLWSFFSKALTSVVGKAIGDYENADATGWSDIAAALPALKGQGVEPYVALRDPLLGRLSKTLTTIEEAIRVQEAIHQRDVALARNEVVELRQMLSEHSRDADYRYNKSVGLAPIFNHVRPPQEDPAWRHPMRWLIRCFAASRANPMWAPMRHATDILEPILRKKDVNILWVASDGVDLLARRLNLPSHGHTRVATFTASCLEPGDMAWHGYFDVCVFELDLTDLQRLQRMYNNIISAVRSGGKVVAFYHHQPMNQLNGDPRFIRHVFPRCEHGFVYYAGSIESLAAVRGHRIVSRWLKAATPGKFRWLRAAIADLMAIPPALYANLREGRRPREKCLMPPRPTTSVTIDIDV